MKAVHYPYTVHKIRLSNGCEIAYADEGNGDKTILFIHGLALYALSWRKNIDYLRQHYRCIAIDLPGNGLSGKGDYPYTISFFAECVYELVQTLKLQHLCIAGHSMGGQIAMKLEALYPGYADQLALCAPAGFEIFNHFQRSVYKHTIALLDIFATEEKSLRRVLRMSCFQYHPYVEEMSEELIALMHSQPLVQYRRMIEACIDGMLNEPVIQELHKIRIPVLVIFGERDALIPNRMIHPVTTRHIAEAGVELMPDAELVMLPKCGHFLNIEKATEINGLLHQFIQR